MTKQTSVNLDITANADGWDAKGGITPRKLTLTGADITLTGSGAETYTFPVSTDTLAGLGTAQEFTETNRFAKVELTDATTHIVRDGSNNIVFTDANAGARTLAQLVGYTNQIMMWNGLLEDIPAGWIICDGSNGTPDLRDKFVRGAGAGDEAGATGGSETHVHLVTGTSAITSIAHVHNVLTIVNTGFALGLLMQVQAGAGAFVPCAIHYHCVNAHTTDSADPNHAHTISFNSASCSTLPSYHELIFIMRS